MFNYYILDPLRTELDMGEAGSLSDIDPSQGPMIFRHPKEANEFLNKLQQQETFMQILVVHGQVCCHRLLVIDPECERPIKMEEILLTLPGILKEQVASGEETGDWTPESLNTLKLSIGELVREPMTL